jgi:TolB protein
VPGALALLLLLAAAPASRPDFVHSLTPADSLIRPGETHFAHLWQVTTDGQSACPRWSPDGTWLAFESTHGGLACPQVFTVNQIAPGKPMIRLASQGSGFATSPAFIEGYIVLSRTNADSCSSMAERWRKAKWPLLPKSRIVESGIDSFRPVSVEGAIECNTSPDGKKIVYTATPAADPEIYVMNADGTNVCRLTTDPGYDGGACFSPDGQSICFQAYHPREESEKAEFVDLLARHQVSSAHLDIWIMHADGTGRGQVSDLEATSMNPSFTPDGKRIIFSSDYQDPQGRQFDLYVTKLDGGTPEKITNDPSPDGFPMFSPNGRYLAFTSGRGAARAAGAQDVFIAEWKN